jgi:hypothetical protein
MEDFVVIAGDRASFPRVPCPSCGTVNQNKFPAEIAIHSLGPKRFDVPHVFLFPMVLVCLKCGHADFVVPETGLRVLVKNNAGEAGALNRLGD